MVRAYRRKWVKNESGKKVAHYQIYCIDRYEHPGGGRPARGLSMYGAKNACAKRGKRLCSGSEWRMACGGRKYPYGNIYDPTMCNTMSMAGEERPIARVGYYRRCRSGWGVFDMSGNVAEWTSDGRVRGGDSYRTAEAAGCGYSQRRSPNSTSQFVGVRCCAEPTLVPDNKGSKK
jgi:formylglycine-generating enzyme required for sulfatase activity